MKKRNRDIEKHLNIHAITLIATVFVTAILDAANIYKISASVMTVFLVGYTAYIVISTVMMVGKEDNSKEEKTDKKKQKK